VLDAALFCNVLKFLLFVALSTRCSGVCDPFDIVPCVSLSCWGCLRLIACPVFDAPRPMIETPLSFSASVLVGFGLAFSWLFTLCLKRVVVGHSERLSLYMPSQSS
jgi:hypothetical protein